MPDVYDRRGAAEIVGRPSTVTYGCVARSVGRRLTFVEFARSFGRRGSVRSKLTAAPGRTVPAVYGVPCVRLRGEFAARCAMATRAGAGRRCGPLDQATDVAPMK